MQKPDASRKKLLMKSPFLLALFLFQTFSVRIFPIAKIRAWKIDTKIGRTPVTVSGSWIPPRQRSHSIHRLIGHEADCDPSDAQLWGRLDWRKKLSHVSSDFKKEELIFSIRNLTKFEKESKFSSVSCGGNNGGIHDSAPDRNHFRLMHRKSGFNLEWPAWFLRQDQCRKLFGGKTSVCHILTHLALRLIFSSAGSVYIARRHSCSISGDAHAQFPADFTAQPHSKVEKFTASLKEILQRNFWT